MNNKRGFTLIELLCTVAIMSFIATLVSINMVKLINTKEQLNTESKNSIITTSACLYIELKENANLKRECLKDSCLISTDTLIQKGLLDSRLIDKEINVKIYQENNEKKCVIE